MDIIYILYYRMKDYELIIILVPTNMDECAVTLVDKRRSNAVETTERRRRRRAVLINLAVAVVKRKRMKGQIMILEYQRCLCLNS